MNDFPDSVFQNLPGPLIRWFEQNVRPLPWRDSPTPYAVWISEIMLQQTRIEAVKSYYTRFMEALPDIASLADADEEQILKLWEGLGYYSRARNLHKAAKIIRDEYQGIFPSHPDKIRSLPGIGDYTAGAIASIAFGLPEPAVDGNVMRVLARLAGFRSDIRNPKIRQMVSGKLRSVYPADKASSFTQGLMELGEVICVPNGKPSCLLCPLHSFCLAAQMPDPETIPVKSPKKERPVIRRTILILRCGNELALRKRPDTGLLAGLWEYPSADGWISQKEASALLGGLAVKKGPEATHVFSHLEWHMKSWQAECPVRLSGFDWFDRANLPALPSAFRTFR